MQSEQSKAQEMDCEDSDPRELRQVSEKDLPQNSKAIFDEQFDGDLSPHSEQKSQGVWNEENSQRLNFFQGSPRFPTDQQIQMSEISNHQLERMIPQRELTSKQKYEEKRKRAKWQLKALVLDLIKFQRKGQKKYQILFYLIQNQLNKLYQISKDQNLYKELLEQDLNFPILCTLHFFKLFKNKKNPGIQQLKKFGDDYQQRIWKNVKKGEQCLNFVLKEFYRIWAILEIKEDETFLSNIDKVCKFYK